MINIHQHRLLITFQLNSIFVHGPDVNIINSYYYIIHKVSSIFQRLFFQFCEHFVIVTNTGMLHINGYVGRDMELEILLNILEYGDSFCV